MKHTFTLIISLLVGLTILQSCSNNSDKKDWIKNAVIYEVNLQMIGPDGNFKSLQKELPHLQKMGVDILWFMPIHPRAKIMRGGKLGNPYQPADYFGINELYGTKEDFRALVKDIHSRKMKIILDEVPNHCGWDNKLITEHPEYFVHDSLGNICYAYVYKAMAQLDYSKQVVRDYMLGVMKYWVKEFDIDGYRMDCSWAIPFDFWNKAIPELNKVKPVLMLAEAEGPEFHRSGFDMTYAWEFMILRGDMMNHVKNVWDLDTLMKAEQKKYQKKDIRMYFTTNHDEEGFGRRHVDMEKLFKEMNKDAVSNSSYTPKGWPGLPGIARMTGHSFERLKGEAKAFTAFTFTVPGMPLIYNGQETAYESWGDLVNHPVYIDFQDHDMTDFYTQLISIKHENPALWNGGYGGDYERIMNGADSSVISFVRVKDNNRVVSIINLSDQVQTIAINSDKLNGRFTDLLKNGYTIENLNGKHFELEPYEYRIFSAK